MNELVGLDSNLEVPAKPKREPKTPPVGMPKLVKIVLEENDNIPPTGLFVGLNGRGYLIRPGEEVNVPQGVVEILDCAVESKPVINSGSRQVTGYRDRMRYPYRKVS